MRIRKFEIALALLILSGLASAQERLKVRITWGEEARQAAPYFVKLSPATPGLRVEDVTNISLKPGAGNVDGLECVLVTTHAPTEAPRGLHIIWADLIAHSDADTAKRLGRDASMAPDEPRLTVQLNAEGTRGFTVTLDQLRKEKALWIPSLHVFVAAGDNPPTFAEHKKALEAWSGKRILDRVRDEPEATYQQYTSRWEDMGSPSYANPQQQGPGHIVCLTWDSAIPKFGIDRGAGVWNDYGNPDHFQFWFDFGDLTQGIAKTRKSQSLHDGLPVITTVFEKDGVRYEVEQFAYPLDGPPKERRGDLKMVLLQRLRVTELQGQARTLPVPFSHRRQFPAWLNEIISVDRNGSDVLFREKAYQKAMLAISGVQGEFQWSAVTDYQKDKRVNGALLANLPANGTQEFIVKLPSALVPAEEAAKLQAIDYDKARAETLKFWSAYVDRGARFEVPEKPVNDLYRANLWHALRLPRRHGGSQPGVTIDLPYSNFAYSQTGTPWPVNQSVYVDYMLYDLRGYHEISTEELIAQYRNNQEADGHVNGFANWLSYSPGMLYSVAQNYLLSHDRAALDRLMPYSLKALDWCLNQMQAAEFLPENARGLVTGPLNDLTGEGLWAFNQAYMYAGLDLFGRVLEETGNSRAAQCRQAARAIKEAVNRGFGAASMRSPLIQLRDHTWVPYVPCEARTSRRILEQWYPTDIDTGAVHMIRLKAIAADSDLADSLLNDHEDNLYLNGWGIANEPVYNQQATAYLLRDEPTAVIRTFYSYMASAFSHSVFEPVEHRWTHGQYFGPPSTDGAWSELYRNMLIHERDDGALVLGMATPRRWLADGQKIVVERAPTYYGDMSMTIESKSNSNQITATIAMPNHSRPKDLLVRLRHPEAKAIRSVLVNGRKWTEFDAKKEWVRIPAPAESKYIIEASY